MLQVAKMFQRAEVQRAKGRSHWVIIQVREEESLVLEGLLDLPFPQLVLFNKVLFKNAISCPFLTTVEEVETSVSIDTICFAYSKTVTAPFLLI